jgi:hypothetical protein
VAQLQATSATSRELTTTKLSLLTRLSLRRCVGSRQLRCGCLVGFYERFAGNVLPVVDAACPQHQGWLGESLPVDAS